MNEEEQNIKLYLVKFTDKSNKQYFYKFGITHNYDVLKRFEDPEYDPWDVTVMVSAYGPRSLVETAEKNLLEKYPKNLWIEQKISGVTEIVVLSKRQLMEAILEIKTYGNEWYEQRKKK